MVVVGRPFATIGRSPAADLVVPSPSAGLRHVYLHLDRRGVFAVDLISRTGTRFDGAGGGDRACWLLPGRGLELAGYRIELLEAGPIDAEAARGPKPDPLSEAAGLPPLELLPGGDPDRPMMLLSELSFLGRSRRCAIQAQGDGVAKVHAVVVRSPGGTFVANLAGPALTVNGEPTGPACRLRDGDRLELGHSRFDVRLRPRPGDSASAVVLPATMTTTTLARAEPPGIEDRVLARALRAVRDGQDELVRTNDQFQRALVAAVRQLYEEQATLFERHLDRLDRLQHEVSELRDELRRQFPPGAPPPPQGAAPAPPGALEGPPPAPLSAPRAGGPNGPGRATSWLIDRIGELEGEIDRESRSSWRDLFSRLGPPLRAREDA